MSEPQPVYLDVDRLLRETQFEFVLPRRGEKLTLRLAHKDEPGYLAIKGTVDEYEGQHAFSARLLCLCSVTPRLTFEAALSLGPDAVDAAVEVLTRSGLVKAEPTP